jgi:hypothetical protein
MENEKLDQTSVNPETLPTSASDNLKTIAIWLTQLSCTYNMRVQRNLSLPLSLSPTMTIIHVIIACITNDDLQYVFGQPIYYTVQLCNLYGQRSSTKMENANKQKTFLRTNH